MTDKEKKFINDLKKLLKKYGVEIKGSTDYHRDGEGDERAETTWILTGDDVRIEASDLPTLVELGD